ncbi:MAG: SGNH/GDSL hydrolase family protein [Patescibacteria group bacterium]
MTTARGAWLKFIIVIIVLEIIVIILLGYRAYEKLLKGKVLGVTQVAVIKKQNLIFPQNDQLKYFYEPKPNTDNVIEEEWLGYKAQNTINSDALNERFEYSPFKSPGVFRIVILGDSETFGIFVNTADNYSERLEDLLNRELRCNNINKFEVINLGAPGYDIQYSVHRFKTRGDKYQPDLVIWRVIDNDFQDYIEGIEARMAEYASQTNPAGSAVKEQTNQETISLYLKAGQEMWDKYGEEAIKELQYGELLNFMNQHKYPLLLFTPRNTAEKYKKLLHQTAQSRLFAYFFEGLDSYDKLADTHPSPLGHQQIAEELFGYLINQKIIPCR